ncbi:MAG: site-2 protease family protein [Phycisphaerales bacterium]
MQQTWWVTETLETLGAPALVSWIVLVIGSIVIHELAHGWVAIKCGDDVPLHTGHMTINPFVHIPPMAWIMFALVGYTWGLMPVNPYNFRRRYDDALVSFAGPASNLILAIIFSLFLVIHVRFGHNINNEALRQNLLHFLDMGTWLNLILFFFNLLPVPPLDGSSIIMSFFPAVRRFYSHEKAQILVVVMMIGVFMMGARIVRPAAEWLSDHLVQFWGSLLF